MTIYVNNSVGRSPVSNDLTARINIDWKDKNMMNLQKSFINIVMDNTTYHNCQQLLSCGTE